MGLREQVKAAIGVAPPAAAGSAAPELGAADGAGKVWTLAMLRGQPAVIYFYPKDDTPGCTVESCDFRDRHEEIRGAGATVLGVSTDDAASHRAFADKFKLPFPLLADIDGAIRTRWGTKGLRGTRRVTFLLDREGRIARVWDPVEVQGHVAEVVAALRALP